jgi:hypothetical protein
MSAMIQALDSFNPLPVPALVPLRIGENGHTELTLSNDIQEKIVQFDFQCLRTDATGVAKLAVILDDLLQQITSSTNPDKNELLVTLYKIIGKTRDINGGKGEYTLSYMMILVWHKHYPELALSALQFFVMDPYDIDSSLDSHEPYGSWKDMKYLCKYILDSGGNMQHPLITSCIQGINYTLRLDDKAYCAPPDEESKKNLTLASKWIPREGSTKFGFLYDALATNYFPQYMASVNYVSEANRALTRKKALDKCRAHYRLLCSKLNRHLDTVQIKQTTKNWASINHAKTTSITLAKQRKALLNQKGSENPDRVQCADNLREHLESVRKEGKDKHVSLHDFIKQEDVLVRCEFQGTSSNEYVIPKSGDSDILKELTPYDILIKKLENLRYLPMEKTIRSYLNIVKV